MITINSTTETIIPSVAGTTGLEAATDAGQAINKNYNGGIVDAEGVNVSESKGVQRLEMPMVGQLAKQICMRGIRSVHQPL